MATKTKDISVIILSYNTKKITDTCLKKLKKAVEIAKTKKIKSEIIVVDNASKDGSASMIKKDHSWVKLIKSKKNLGFSGGNNLGMKNSSGELILLLNSDCYIKPSTLVDAVNHMKDNKDCDVLGCKLSYKDGSFQPSAGSLPSPKNIIPWMFFLPYQKLFHPKDENFFAQNKKVGWVMGAFMLTRRSVYKKTKGFDEDFFLYTEEVEWCKRIKDAGFNIFFTPDFSVVHLGRASSKFSIKTPLVKEAQGVLAFFKKHYPKNYEFARLIIFLGSILRIIVYATKRDSERVSAYVQILLNV